MEDPFAVKELRIRQPARMLPGRSRYDIFDPDKTLLAIATETESFDEPAFQANLARMLKK